MCKNNDCNITPSYNIAGKKTALYCSTHKLEGMVNPFRTKSMGN